MELVTLKKSTLKKIFGHKKDEQLDSAGYCDTDV
jgi:hypothetical protein